MSDADPTPEPPGKTRRQLLALTLPTAAAAAVGVPCVRYAITPLTREGEETWVELGPLAELAGSATPVPVRFRYDALVGYVRGSRPGLLFVVPDDTRTDGVAVKSPVCTHKACNVSWSAEESLFACPCHRGRFDVKGAPVAGPPTEPLRDVPTEVRDGVLFARVGEGVA